MRIIFIIIVAIIITGCSTVGARQDNGVGHPYISTEQSLSTAVISTEVAVKLYVVPLLITIPMNIIDIGIALVTDTILLPFDLFSDPKNPNRETTALDGMKI